MKVMISARVAFGLVAKKSVHFLLGRAAVRAHRHGSCAESPCDRHESRLREARIIRDTFEDVCLSLFCANAGAQLEFSR